MGRSLYLLGKHRGAIEASQHVNSLHQEFQRNVPEVYDEAQKMSPDDWEIWHNKGWMVWKMMLIWHKYTLRIILYQHVMLLLNLRVKCWFRPMLHVPSAIWQLHWLLYQGAGFRAGSANVVWTCLKNSLRLKPCCHRRTRFNGMMWLSCSWERRGCVQAADLPLSCRVFPCHRCMPCKRITSRPLMFIRRPKITPTAETERLSTSPMSLL